MVGGSSVAAPRAWVIVSGAGKDLSKEETAAARDVGALLARERYGLIAGTWRGVDQLVTDAFVEASAQSSAPPTLIHVENSGSGGHPTRVGRVIKSSVSELYSEEAVRLADIGIIVSGRTGSKPTMDALLAYRKPVLPLAWLGNDSLECLFDLLRSPSTTREQRRRLHPFIDPETARDETLSRALGALTCRTPDIFVSYHRDEAGPDAGRLAAVLAEQYGERRVFFDHKSLGIGEHTDEILSLAAMSKVLIAILGKTWTTKVARPNDFVAHELRAARVGMACILPVFLDGAIPAAADVPDGLPPIHAINGVQLYPKHWEAAVEELVDAIDKALCIHRMQS